jgi:hypothetical protein
LTRIRSHQVTSDRVDSCVNTFVKSVAPTKVNKKHHILTIRCSAVSGVLPVPHTSRFRTVLTGLQTDSGAVLPLGDRAPLEVHEPSLEDAIEDVLRVE